MEENQKYRQASVKRTEFFDIQSQSEDQESAISFINGENDEINAEVPQAASKIPNYRMMFSFENVSKLVENHNALEL